MYMPDGSFQEVHYLDIGVTDQETGVISSGMVCYEKYVTADGQVEEHTYDVTPEEDGSWWETQELENGITVAIHYAKDWSPIEERIDDPADGSHTETEFYENHAVKKLIRTYANSSKYDCQEYYENGLSKYSLTIYEDGTEIEEKLNEQGYYTYYRRKDQYGEREYFAGENNELVKYIEDGTVYEGDVITADQTSTFKHLQDMAAEVAYNILNGI